MGSSTKSYTNVDLSHSLASLNNFLIYYYCLLEGLILKGLRMENFNFFNSDNTLPPLTSLNFQYEDLKHFFEGYREMMIIHLVGEQTLEDMGINTARYSPGSASRASYDNGRQRAQFDIALLEAYKKS